MPNWLISILNFFGFIKNDTQNEPIKKSSQGSTMFLVCFQDESGYHWFPISAGVVGARALLSGEAILRLQIANRLKYLEAEILKSVGVNSNEVEWLDTVPDNSEWN